jgi:hypothetical protein
VPLARVRLTAAKSSLGRHRNLRLARPQGSDSTSTSDDGLRLARPRGSDSTSTSDNGLRLARPPGSDSTSTSDDGLRLAQLPGSDSTSTSRRWSPPRPTPRLGLNLDLGGVTTSLGPTTPQWGAIITLPLASLGYGGQDRRPIWLAPVKQVMMAPRVLHDNGGSRPLRKQGDVSKDPTAPTAVLLQGSSAPPTATTPHEQGSNTSPTATSACT